MLSERPAFPLALRGTRVVFHLLEQFSSELETEAKNYPHTTHQLTIGETDFGEHRPAWMRGARDGDNAWVSFIPQFWHIGLLVTTRSVYKLCVQTL